jgi:hypothetical protein
MIRWAQVLAISFVGVGALVLTYQNNLVQAMFLYGALASWSLKNGYGLSNHETSGTVPLAADAAGTPGPDSTTIWNENTENSLLSLADEGYENSW